jgi:hypothetical protein
LERLPQGGHQDEKRKASKQLNKMKKKTAKKKMYGGKVKKKTTYNPKPKRKSRTGTTLRPVGKRP